MSRDQQNQVYKTSTANAAQDQGNAQTAFTGAESGLDTFNKNLAEYNANDPYKAGGEFETDQSNINAGRANADSAAVRDTLERHGKTSGANTAGYGANVVAATRQATLDEGTAQAQSDAERLGDETKYQQFGVGASEFPVQANTQLHGQALGGANGSLNTAETAAKQPGLWDTLFSQGILGATAASKFKGDGGGDGGDAEEAAAVAG